MEKCRRFRRNLDMKKMENNFNLLELQEWNEVTKFLSEVEENNLIPPSVIYYDIRQHCTYIVFHTTQ